jgi:hypothetical protein
MIKTTKIRVSSLEVGLGSFGGGELLEEARIMKLEQNHSHFDE